MNDMSSIWTVRRSATDAKLTGLCGGVAQHWGVDPVLVRLGCALLALSGGIGLVLYLAGWLLIPVQGKADAPIHSLLGDQARRWSREVWIVLVALCCIVAFAVFGQLSFGFGPAAILALIWYFGYYKHRRPHSSGCGKAAPPVTAAAPVPAEPQFFRYPGPPTPFTEAAMAWQQRVEQAHRAGPPPYPRAAFTHPEEDLREPVGPADSLPPAMPLGAESFAHQAYLAVPDPVGLYAEGGSIALAPTPAPLRRSASRSAKRLRLLALVALGLTWSGLAAADAMGAAIVPAAYLGASLLVLSLTLVAAAWLGRARGILPVALLVALATVVSSVGGPLAEDRGWGDHRRTYTTAGQLGAGDRLEFGQLTVDLTKLDPRTAASYAAHVDFGSLEVLAPPTMNVVVNYRIRSGAMVVNTEQLEGGGNLSGQLPPTASDPKKKNLTLNLSVDGGVVQVRR
jgi:phage shock protein PspC (stress-responsive transcriptional regulator)